MPGNIIFNGVNINDMTANSGVFIGPSNNNSWDSSQKQNITINGPANSFQLNNLNLINDNDLIDNPITYQKLRRTVL